MRLPRDPHRPRFPATPATEQSVNYRIVIPKIHADFHNADTNGQLRLNCVGTIENLARQRITLGEGMLLTLYSDDLNATGQLDELRVNGIVSFSEEEHCWVAATALN